MGLKGRRIESGLTQAEAADLFGIKYRTYQNYENGITSPSMDTAALFARYFQCTIGDLFDLEEGVDDSLNPDEKALLDAFRAADGEGRRTILNVARALRAE